MMVNNYPTPVIIMKLISQDSFNKISKMECTQKFLETPVHSHDGIRHILGICIHDRRMMGMNGFYTPIQFVSGFREMTKGRGFIGLELVSRFKDHLCRMGFGDVESLVLSVTTYLLSKKLLEDELELFQIPI